MNRKSYYNFTLSGYLMMVLPLALGVTLVSPNGPPSRSTPRMCVNGCTCNNTTVTCVDLGLRRLPLGIPRETTALDLSSNRITQIHVQRLSQTPKLRELHLRGNRIAFIPDTLHLALPQLSILDLSFNPIVCHCPLERLQRQLNNVTHQHLRLVHGNVTDCRKYPNEDERTRIPPNLASCMPRIRKRRTPSCDIECQHGRCIPIPLPHCICDDFYSGQHCENDARTGSTSGGGRPVDITVRRNSPYNITISWVVRADGAARQQYTFVLNVTHVWGEGTRTLTPVRTQEQSFTLGGIRPGTLYIICVTAYGPDDTHYSGCMNFTAPNVTATSTPPKASGSPALVEINGDGSHNRDDGYPFNTADNGGYDNNDYGGGPGVEYAFISLTSLFAICLLLTALVGFVYYKRVYGTGPQGVGGADDSGTSRPNQQGVVVVSTGRDIVYNRGAVNRAFNPDDTHRGAPRTYTRRTDPRSVRFQLQPRYPGRMPAIEGASIPGGPTPYTITGGDITAPTVVQNRGAINVSTGETEPSNESEL